MNSKQIFRAVGFEVIKAAQRSKIGNLGMKNKNIFLPIFVIAFIDEVTIYKILV